MKRCLTSALIREIQIKIKYLKLRMTNQVLVRMCGTNETFIKLKIALGKVGSLIN